MRYLSLVIAKFSIIRVVLIGSWCARGGLDLCGAHLVLVLGGRWGGTENRNGARLVLVHGGRWGGRRKSNGARGTWYSQIERFEI